MCSDIKIALAKLVGLEESELEVSNAWKTCNTKVLPPYVVI